MKFKWLLSFINVIAIVLIAVSLFVLLQVVLTPAGQVPQVMGFSVLRVLTGSMEPTIPENSMLLVRQTEPGSLQVGDVISFVSPDPSLQGALNTHRIVDITEEGGTLWFSTKGDANVLEDPQAVSGSQVLGKVIFVSAVLGKLIALLTNPLVFGLAVLLPLVLILIGNLVRALKSAVTLAKEEEAAAVRQALEEIKEKQNAEEK